MTPVRRAVAILAAPLTLLTACGIKDTPVVEIGRPGVLTVAAPPDAGLLYFVLPDGRLAPVPIPNGPGYGPSGMIPLLMNGPDPEAKAAGLRTELPSSAAPGAIDGRPLTQMTGENSVRVRLPFPVRPLSEAARHQVMCSITSSAGIPADAEVTLAGPDSVLAPDHCGF
ncbi:hypothetical protein ABT236_19850 [Streptomyces sp. NPDC001523]|uniref:hypothetical protein n=1 Tax=Streptomyces sp. NPDC001523 TaxID=3154383 RepID=UPI003331CDB2